MSRILAAAMFAFAIGTHPFASVGQAADEDARAILEQAIKALGGEPAVARLKAPMMWMEKGTYYGMGDQGLPYIGQYASRWPGWYRQEIEGVFTLTISGESAWISSPGGVDKLAGEQLKERLQQVRVAWATRLFPLTDKAYTLSKIDGIEVEGRPTVGIKAAHADGRDLKIYFDARTHLIAKTETTVIAPEHGPKPVSSEAYYLNHRNFGGVMMPSRLKLYYDKKLFVEAETVDCKVHATLDPNWFEVPK